MSLAGVIAVCIGGVQTHPLQAIRVAVHSRFPFVGGRLCGESPLAKLQRVSSEDRKTPFCGQAVKQSSGGVVCVGVLRNSTVMP